MADAHCSIIVQAKPADLEFIDVLVKQLDKPADVVSELKIFSL